MSIAIVTIILNFLNRVIKIDQYSKFNLLESIIGDSVVCISVYYTFSGSTKTVTFTKTEVLVLCYILFSLVLKSGSLHLYSVLAKGL